jgi:D-proline reductase (dithiol) PrdB
LGDLREFSFKHRIFLRSYPWRRIDPVPWTPLEKPLARCRLAIVSSAGFVLPDQPRFDEAKRGGDTSFREIPADIPASTLVDAHRSETFDHTAMREDPNLAFPVDRVRELADRGRIESVNRRHLRFMGAITAAGRLPRHTAPEATRALTEDRVDIALLVPV